MSLKITRTKTSINLHSVQQEWKYFGDRKREREKEEREIVLGYYTRITYYP